MDTAKEQLAEWKAFACQLARDAGKEILPHFRSSELAVESKADDSPVTVADRAAERFMRQRIMEVYPDHGIIGEEYGRHQEAAEVVWILDPIDGTKSFITGVALFTTLIAVQVKGESQIGVIYQPVGDELIVGDNLETHYNGTLVSGPSDVDLDQATLLTSDPSNPLLYGGGTRWNDLLEHVRLYRSWGDAYGYLILGTGRAHIMTDPILEIWDIAALLPVLKGAGIKATTWNGDEPKLEQTSLIAAPPALHAKVMKVLQSQ